MIDQRIHLHQNWLTWTEKKKSDRRYRKIRTSRETKSCSSGAEWIEKCGLRAGYPTGLSTIRWTEQRRQPQPGRLPQSCETSSAETESQNEEIKNRLRNRDNMKKPDYYVAGIAHRDEASTTDEEDYHDNNIESHNNVSSAITWSFLRVRIEAAAETISWLGGDTIQSPSSPRRNSSG